MNFSAALEIVKSGGIMTRFGWNGGRMFIFLVPGSTFSVSGPPLLGILPDGAKVNYHAHIDMRTMSGMIVPWVCSQTDMLSDDWEQVHKIG